MTDIAFIFLFCCFALWLHLFKAHGFEGKFFENCYMYFHFALILDPVKQADIRSNLKAGYVWTHSQGWDHVGRTNQNVQISLKRPTILKFPSRKTFCVWHPSWQPPLFVVVSDCYPLTVGELVLIAPQSRNWWNFLHIMCWCNIWGERRYFSAFSSNVRLHGIGRGLK